MKISTKGRYGVRLMLDLALNAGKKAVSLKDVAERQAISEKYLWQIVAPLKAAGLVEAVRGAHGGYRLARAPRALSVRDIVEVLEGGIALVDCTARADVCDRAAECVTRELWRSLSEILAGAMDKVSLADLAEQHERRHRKPVMNFDI